MSDDAHRRSPAKIVLPIVILLAAAGGTWLMVASRTAPEQRARETPAPLVRVRSVAPETVRLDVVTQGTVRPRTESTLVPEVAGRVIEVADAFVAGGFFDRGELLLRIDPADYREAVTRAGAMVSQAELRIELERAEAAVARREWEQLGGADGTEAPPLTLREPQLAEARAALDAARAELARAERDLRRTEIRAPYRGRVREKRADLGQYVARGQALATIYAVDAAEIRLPLADDELAFVELPLAYRDARAGSGPAVRLTARFAGAEHEWRGRIVRTEGEIDPRTRLIHAVARVDDPYGSGPAGRPPLAVGLFVEARIEGRTVDDLVRLPREALRPGDELLVVDDDSRLRVRRVDVLRRTADDVLIRGGLEPGERVCVSPLEIATDGMRVRVADDDGAEA